MGITYEEMRQFYNNSEQREQQLIVQVQRLMNKVKQLEKERQEVVNLTKKVE